MSEPKTVTGARDPAKAAGDRPFSFVPPSFPAEGAGRHDSQQADSMIDLARATLRRV